jgi:hypothetical protein
MDGSQRAHLALAPSTLTLAPTYVAGRAALLDALEALRGQSDALVLVGAQAIYLYTGDADVPVATETKDSDVLVDPSFLDPDPKLEEAMTAADFVRNLQSGQPGEWLNRDGIPVDLLVPSSLAAGNRGARLPPHSKYAARRVAGLEAAIVDNEIHEIVSLVPGDDRVFQIKVAGPSALLVAKLHKLGDRQETPSRLLNKDAHDMYRLMRAVKIEVFQEGFELLLGTRLAEEAVATGLRYLEDLFESPDALGPRMAGNAEELVGDPQLVAASTHQLAQDVLAVAGR